MSEAKRLAALSALRDEVADQMGGLKDRCQEKLQQLSSATPTLLYHYTDTRGFMGIISKSALWATRTDFLNDSSEIPYARDLYKERIEHFRQQRNSVEELKLLDWLEINCDFVREYFKTYAISLSSKHDDLSQWRGYSGGLGGYSIGFDFTGIRLATSIFEARKESEPRIVQMTYEQDRQIECLDDLIEQVLVLFGAFVGKVPTHLMGNLMRFISQHVINLVADYFIRFKNPAFRDELEWRLVVLGNSGESVHYRDSRFGLIPYLKYSGHPLPIKKVVQGPRSEPELAKEAVLGFLEKNRYAGVEVCPSKVPLRF